MICDKCKQRPATVHMTKIENGVKTETNLCEVCAKAEDSLGFGIEPQLILHSIFADLFNQALPEGQPVAVPQAKPVHCEQCGFTDTQFTKVGKLGCPECYDVFAKQLEPLLRRVHGNPQHTGKIPKRTGGTIGLRKEIANLKLKLQEAVSQEEYETAARLRDEIRGLENRLSQEGV